MEDIRFLPQRSPRNELPPMSLVSPSRNGNGLPQHPAAGGADPRAALPRRFTTDSGRVPTLSSINTAPGQRGPEPGGASYEQFTAHLIEKKRQEYEKLVSQRRRFEAEMARIDQMRQREALELAQLQEELAYNSGGHQSEPTTPPEYRETSGGFPTPFSRPNRYSTSSLTSPPGIFGRTGRSGSQLASPRASFTSSRSFAHDDQLPLRSLPASRRNSDDDEKEEAVRQDPTSHRSTNALNRYSMPVTRSSRGFYDLSLDQANTARFLFGDDESTQPDQQHAQAATDDFPTLLRQNDQMATYTPGDVAPVKNPVGPSVSSNANNHAQQHLHNHNYNIGRIPAGAKVNRHSREMSVEKANSAASAGMEQAAPYASIGSALQANAPPFGPNATMTAQQGPPPASSTPVSNGMMGAAGGHYPGYYPPSTYAGGNGLGASAASYNLQALTAAMGNMNVNGPQVYPQHFPQFGSTSYQQHHQPRDSQARVIQNRRLQDSEQMSKYNNLPLDSVKGQIYELCKDQHGCRYLQRKLEERIPEATHDIWLETHQHVVELMTDPFGNYLCQKLLEYCAEAERTKLIEIAATDMPRIAVNQHGTRALQKMIEYVQTPEQIQTIIRALQDCVVELIQDLNGNHVIQKCLNKLEPGDASFIFTAVGNHCVDVGTHRHGCCVLQRCIDHAHGSHKQWLVQRITMDARGLVEDPFGNYVVQYIIDLNEPAFTEPLVQQFKGQIVALSKHKFSSNVIEKCLRCCREESRDMIVEELLESNEMDRILRDSFANYVVQTALDYATPEYKRRLVEALRPLLPSIRATPYGRRIQGKIQNYDARPNPDPNPIGQVTPTDLTQGQMPLRPGHARAMSSNTSILSHGGSFGLTAMSGMPSANGPQNRPTYPTASNIIVPPQHVQPHIATQQQPQHIPPMPRSNGSGNGGVDGNQSFF